MKIAIDVPCPIAQLSLILACTDLGHEPGRVFEADVVITTNDVLGRFCQAAGKQVILFQLCEDDAIKLKASNMPVVTCIDPVAMRQKLEGLIKASDQSTVQP